MTHDPETAERLAAILTPLITEQSCGEWDDKTINEDVQMFLPPLLTALQEARNAALCEAADLCVEYSTHHGTGMFDKHSHACSEAILALIDTPAPPPPAPPAGDVLRMSQTLADIAAGSGMFGIDLKADLEWAMWEARAALAAAPAPQPEKIMCSRCDGSGYAWAVGNCPDCNGDGWVNAPIQPAPQPDADEREALVVAMSMDIRDNIDIEWAEAKTAADALLAAGWTRKREEG